jgi:Rieske Fe-S protein
VAGALTIASLVTDGDSRFAEVLDPSRKTPSPPALKEFAEGVAGAVKDLAEHLLPGEIGSADELAPGEGGIMRDGLRKVAVYKDLDGEVIRRSAVCTHVGCQVKWNAFERCWDCPCHGSQFSVDGQVLNGPAIKPLATAD